MKKEMKKIIVAVLAMVFMFTFQVENVKADTQSWSLRYVAHAQESANVTSWSNTMVTTKATTTMTVSQVGGGARIFVYTNNGIASLFTGKGTTSVPASKYVMIYSSVTYDIKGDYNNTPSGTVSY